jgi:hypothetical protein
VAERSAQQARGQARRDVSASSKALLRDPSVLTKDHQSFTIPLAGNGPHRHTTCPLVTTPGFRGHSRRPALYVRLMRSFLHRAVNRPWGPTSRMSHAAARVAPRRLHFDIMPARPCLRCWPSSVRVGTVPAAGASGLEAVSDGSDDGCDRAVPFAEDTLLPSMRARSAQSGFQTGRTHTSD